ncbi:hypothetical protein J4464_01430 [Candidatus Woesearchaeota archaeon]|nr:hypothetical protein [Candidatus Woesearchaeota archaeon]
MKLIPIIAATFLLVGCSGISDKPDASRGIYLNAWLAGNEIRLNEYVVRMRNTGINTVIIHMQDTDGILPYDSKIPYAIEINATEIRIKNVSALVDRLHADGFYVIAKVDTFKDRKLAYAHPEYAFSYKNGSLFEDRFGVHIDPNNPVVWEYKKAIYEEMFDFGFDEVMIDYIRYPERAYYGALNSPFTKGDTSMETIEGFMQYIRASLPYQTFSVAIFSNVCLGEDHAIGQSVDIFAPYVQYISPMLYVSLDPYEPWQDARGFIAKRTEACLIRIQGSNAKLRPWLQGYSDRYQTMNASAIQQQIKTVERFPGVAGWQIWNSAGNYNATFKALEENKSNRG